MKIRLGSGPVKIIPTPEPPPPKTDRLLPNWLLAYQEYTQMSEAPPSFHLWVGLGTIMGAAQRKIYMRTEYFDVHSNMFVVLVGPPGKVKKSTALRIGKRLLKEVPGIHFTTSATSAASLIEQMAAITARDHQSMTAFSSELGTFLSVDMAAMTDFLTDIWDGDPDWDKQTRKKGVETINAPWLSLLAGTTPQWMGDNMSKTIVEGGLVARCIFIHENQRVLKSPFPKGTERHKILRKALVNDLTHISALNGEFTFSPEAEKFYDEWYMNPVRFPDSDDPRIMGYFDRKHVHVLKVAMALSLAEKDDLVLERRDIETALSLLKEVEPKMSRAFVNVGKNPMATDTDRVYEQIGSAKGLSYQHILAAHWHNVNKKALDDILVDLRCMEKIEIGTDGLYYLAGRSPKVEQNVPTKTAIPQASSSASPQDKTASSSQE